MKAFGIPIKIEVSFFVLAVFLAASRMSAPAFLVEWLLVVFFSVLVHEFGHALAARAFGFSPTVRLYAMGGLTAYSPDARSSVTRSLVISLAGPAMGFLAGGTIFLCGTFLFHFASSDLLFTTYYDLLWVNVGWGLFNMLPVLPLDGGSVLLALEEGILGRKEQVLSHTISLLVALAITLWALSVHWSWVAFLGVWFAYSNGSFLWQKIQQRRDQKLEPLLTEARAAVNKRETDLGLDLIRTVQKKARTSPVKREAASLLIFGLIQQEKYEEAQKELRMLEVLFGGDSYLEGLVHFQKGDMVNALPHLRAAFNSSPSKEVGLVLNQALIAQKEFPEVLDLCAHVAMEEVSWSLLANLQTESFNQGDFEVSVRAGLLAWGQQPDADIAYNIGCAYARGTNPGEAIKWIKSALDSGFDKKDLLVSDSDLDPLRSMAEFKQLLADV